MVYFTDCFNINEDVLNQYGAFNISLINDLPLFIDPFLLYASKKEEYKKLHEGILDYLLFLKEKSEDGYLTEAEIKSWYKFSEVKQNWLGYSISGNGGSGLGLKFGKAMSDNMHVVYSDLNKEMITQTSHMEKVGLFQLGVGRDNISDFSCNLIKSYLLEYTEHFAKKYLQVKQTKKINVPKVYFDYELERWMSKEFVLPFYNNDYIILTPKDLLTKDENWINSHDLRGHFLEICGSIPNDQLRSEINSFYFSRLPSPTRIKGRNTQKQPTLKEIAIAVNQTIQQYPELLDFYIKQKEENKEGAKNISKEKVLEVETLFKSNVQYLIHELLKQSEFYSLPPEGSFNEALKRVLYLKDFIENKDGYKLFYYKNEPIKREADLQVIYRLTWYSSPFDVNREVNNGRGPVDYTVSKGSRDKTLIEFKLASNSKLRMNLENQVKVYEEANDTKQSIKVIMYFNDVEYVKLTKVLKELNLENDPNIVLIDARDNKPSASNVK